MADAKTVQKGKSAADLLAASTGIPAPAAKPKPALLAVDAKAEADLKGMSLRSGGTSPPPPLDAEQAPLTD